MEQQFYQLEHLNCAHCASKIEEKIASLPEVQEATLTFTTKKLEVVLIPGQETALNSADFQKKLQDISVSIEPGVKLCPYEDSLGSEKKKEESPALFSKAFLLENLETVTLFTGVFFFVIGTISDYLSIPSYLFFYFISYFLLGGEVLISAFRSLIKGQMLDENFLMGIATIGAIAIGEYPEAVGVMLFYRIGEFFEEKAVEKSRTQIMDALDLRPETVTLFSDGCGITIPAKVAKPGDLLLVRPGDRIPLDGKLIEGESRLDTSPLTGEPIPVSVHIGDKLTSGCINLSGVIKMEVEYSLEESMVTRILHSVEKAASSKPKMDRFITKFSRVYTPFVIVMALTTAFLPPIFLGDWKYWFYTALTFLVISCPCALVLSVPLTFFSGIGAGSKQGILFKGGIALEAISGIKAIIMDKTGTLTKGTFQVEQILSKYEDVTQEQLLQLAASCEANSTHPIAQSILSEASSRKLTLFPQSDVTEFAGKGILARLGEDQILCGNEALLKSNQVELNQYNPSEYGTEILVAKNGTFLGSLIISDQLKEDAKDTISNLKRAGYHTVILTGDSQQSGDYIGKAAGVDEVYGKLLPQDKVDLLEQLRKRFGPVMFIGDGINDAPVLAGADVGAAMGSGADSAIEAADIVYLHSDLTSVSESVRIAGATKAIALQNVVFALSIKAIVMILGLLGFASMWFAVFADSGVAILCVLNAIRILYIRKK